MKKTLYLLLLGGVFYSGGVFAYCFENDYTGLKQEAGLQLLTEGSDGYLTTSTPSGRDNTYESTTINKADLVYTLASCDVNGWNIEFSALFNLHSMRRDYSETASLPITTLSQTTYDGDAAGMLQFFVGYQW